MPSPADDAKDETGDADQCVSGKLEPDNDEDECDKQYDVDVNRCRMVTQMLGKKEGESCYVSATKRLSECMRPGFANYKTSLYVGF